MIEPGLVAEIGPWLQQQADVEQAVWQLRRDFPELHFSYCSDDDTAEHARPVFNGDNANIYLVCGGNHCLSLTDDFEQAAGVVVAEVYPED